MNAGELKDKISVLTLKEAESNYFWEIKASIWAKVEQLKKNNIFSEAGIGAKSIKFTIRKNSTFTLHNAFQWQGKHCFLTDITDIEHMYYVVTAAIMEPRICIVERTERPVLNELNRPVYGAPILLTFPGCLIEKHLDHTQKKPMAYTETRYVLVTPKPIQLAVGELVSINGISYAVVIPHTLDDYKNEYEIIAKEDV